MIVKKIATSQNAAPKSKAANVRALTDYIAGPGPAATARRSSTEGPSWEMVRNVHRGTD